MLNFAAANPTGQAMVAAMLSHSQDCVKLLDTDGRLAFMSENGLAAMHIAQFAEVQGAKWRDLWPESGRHAVDKAVNRALNRQSARFQAFCPTGKGEPRWWDVVASPLLDEDGEVCQILVTSRDISFQYTDEGRAEALRALVQQLQNEREQLAKAKAEVVHVEKVRLLGQFAGGIVHDLNNILATMSSASSLLRRRVDSPVANDILNHVDQAVVRGSELTRQLLDFSRKDVGAAEIVNLRDLVETDRGLMRHLVGADIKLKIECAEGVEPVLAPSSRLRSVLFNLLANSRDAMDGEGTITIRMAPRTYFGPVGAIASGEYAVLEVSDTGCGMTSEVVEKLGSAFFTTKASGKGTGLGIPSAFELAEMCGGFVEIDSAPGKGTAIRIVMRTSDVSADLEDHVGNGVDPLLHGNATILLIENDGFLRDHLASSLRGLGYSVLEAVSAASAIGESLAAAKVDLLISDLFLDGSSGYDAAARLRQTAPALPCIFISGTHGMGILQGEVVMRKPVHEAALARLVLEQLGRLPARHLTEKLLAQSERVKSRLHSPAIIAAYDAWRSACKVGHRLPSRAAMAPVEPILGSTSYIAEVAGTIDIPTFRYIEVSPQLEERLGRPLEGSYITSADDDGLGSLARAMVRATKGVPYYDYAIVRAGPTKAKFERLLLPLSDNGRDVTHIIGVVTIDEDHVPAAATAGEPRGNANV